MPLENLGLMLAACQQQVYVLVDYKAIKEQRCNPTHINGAPMYSHNLEQLSQIFGASLNSNSFH